MEGTLTSIIELVAAVAIMVLFGGVFKQDKHDDDQLKPVRVPVTYKYQRRIRR
jgi:hypothetical protein